MSGDGEDLTVGKRTRGRTEDDPDEESPAKRYKDELDEELEEDEKKMAFSTPPPTISQLGGLNGLMGSARRDLKTTGGHDKPAELFRKDLISAMKMADSDPLQPDDYFGIVDPWRQDWERGVQVPVNRDLIHDPKCSVVEGNEKLHGPYAFKLPKKFLHAQADDNYKQGVHELHETQKLAEDVCRYDLDDLDVSWLSMANKEFENSGQPLLQEWEMEKVMEELEAQCYTNMQQMIKTVEGLGIEYDENVVCDVCRSPESEDCNEMVFCDSCDICVHQACYGIQKIPDGSWLCRTCALGISPMCILCPRKGGAMKSTKSGSKWAHVSCALWIPEVSIGFPEKMEPITKISQIPSSRWSLICSLCRERTGACIQCCVKTCKTAFHVTCAFANGLDMKTVLDEVVEDVQLKAYCLKHTKKKDGESTPRKTPPPTPRKESEMTEQEKTEFRSHRLAKLAEEFYICVKPADVAKALHMEHSMTAVDFVYSYWVLKRKAMFNKPLLMPKRVEADMLTKQREDSLIARMKMFIHLRQDLERVRNLCYMVSRREKVRRQLYRLKEEVFHKQAALLNEDSSVLTHPGTREFKAITKAHKLPAEESIYDQYDGILNTAEILDGPHLDMSAEPVRLDRPRGPGRPPRMLDGRFKGKGLKGKGKAGKESGVKKSEEVSKPSENAQEVKKEVVEVKEEIKEEPNEEEAEEDAGVEEEEEQGEEVTILTRGLRSRVVSSPVPAPRSPYHHPAGAKSPQQEARSPHPGAKSPAHGSSAPATLPEPRRPKALVSKNLFKDMHFQAEAEEERTLRSRIVRSPHPHSSVMESDSDSESVLVKKALRSRTVVTPVPHEEDSNQSSVVKEEKGEKTPAASQQTGGKGKGKSGVTQEGTEETDASSVTKESGAGFKRRPLRPRTPASPASNQEEVMSDENVCEVSQKELRSRTRSMPEERSHMAPSPATTSDSTALTAPPDPGTLSEDLRLRERQQNIRLKPQPLKERGGRRRRTASTHSMEKKTILNGILASSSLIVSQDIRDRVQQRLRRSNNRRPFPNGICPHTQRKIDSYFGCQSRTEDGRVRSPPSVQSNRGARRKNALSSSSWSASDISRAMGMTRSPHRSNSPWQSSSQGRLTPETRSSRRRMESDLESEAASERGSESMDGEPKVKSSRETTPDSDMLVRRPSSRRGLEFSRLGLDRRTAHRLAEGSITGSDESSYIEMRSDSEYAPSEADSEDSVAHHTRRSSRRISRNQDIFDEGSRDSIASSSSVGNKYSTRSKLSDPMAQLVGTFPR